MWYFIDNGFYVQSGTSCYFFDYTTRELQHRLQHDIVRHNPSATLVDAVAVLVNKDGVVEEVKISEYQKAIRPFALKEPVALEVLQQALYSMQGFLFRLEQECPYEYKMYTYLYKPGIHQLGGL